MQKITYINRIQIDMRQTLMRSGKHAARSGSAIVPSTRRFPALTPVTVAGQGYLTVMLCVVVENSLSGFR